MQVLAKARELSRLIYASLPWGYRVAGVFIHLASSLTDTVGKVIYHAFIQAGVEGMPLISGEPPTLEKFKRPERLPSGYGKRFAEKLYALLLAKARNPDVVEEVLSQFLVKVAQGKLEGLKPGAPIGMAEGYVSQMVVRVLMDHLRAEFGRHEKSRKPKLEDIDAEGFNPADPDAFRHLDKMLPRSEMTRLMRDLEQVNDRAPSWLEAKLNGLKGVEIAEEWGVGKSRITEWENRYVPEIKAIMIQYLQDAA